MGLCSRHTLGDEADQGPCRRLEDRHLEKHDVRKSHSPGPVFLTEIIAKYQGAHRAEYEMNDKPLEITEGACFLC